ncbi:MAG: hypothetical protein AB7L13_22395 [Acidimicrobiia bacterium]
MQPTKCGPARRSSWPVAVLLVALLVVARPAASPAAAGTGSPSRFVPVSPIRILDTRTGLGWPNGRLGFGGSMTLDIVGRGVPTSASAVAMNVTMTDSASAGYLSVWPSGLVRPEVSNLNVSGGGQTVANLVVSALGAGRVDLYASTSTDIVADVVGYFVPVPTSTFGRFERVEPTRVADTRVDGTGRLAAQQERSIAIAGRAGVPNDATAVVMTVTAANPGAAGYVVVWPDGRARPATSTLNMPGPGVSVPNLVLSGLGNGAIRVASMVATDVVVDVVGFVTGNSATLTNEGLFVPVDPSRLVDTRTGAPITRLAAGYRSDVTVAGSAPIPSNGVGAVFANLTSTRVLGGSYLTAYPAVTRTPPTSNVNVANGETAASAAVVSLGNGGRMSLYSMASSDVVVDVFGFFVGSPVDPDAEVPDVAPSPPTTPLGPGPTPDTFAVVYALPADSPFDPQLPDAIRHELDVVNAWFGGQTDGRYLRFRTADSRVEVNVVTLTQTTAQLQARTDVLNAITQELLATRQISPFEYSLVYVPITTSSCGQSGAGVSIVFMRQCAGTPRIDSATFGQGALFVAAHEMVHTLGAVPGCAPHFDGSGHVDDDPRDLMYVGPRAHDYTHVTLDPGRDDYYGHGRGDCFDVATSAAWG